MTTGYPRLRSASTVAWPTEGESVTDGDAVATIVGGNERARNRMVSRPGLESGTPWLAAGRLDRDAGQAD